MSDDPLAAVEHPDEQGSYSDYSDPTTLHALRNYQDHVRQDHPDTDDAWRNYEDHVRRNEGSDDE